MQRETCALDELMRSLVIPQDEIYHDLISLHASAKAVASRTCQHGQWHILQYSHNQHRPPLQCAIRDGGYFRSRSQYNRNHIDIIQDICEVIQNHLRRGVMAFSTRMARWANTTLEEARRILSQMNEPGIDGSLQPVRQEVQQLIRTMQASLSDVFLRQRIRNFIHFGLYPNFMAVLMDDTENAVRGISQILLGQLQALQDDITRTFQQLLTRHQESKDTQLEGLLSLLNSGSYRVCTCVLQFMRPSHSWICLLQPAA